MPEIKIGQAVDIIVELGLIKASFVQDILDDRIVLLQITPPLPGSYINKTILVTYLTKEERHVRWCFQASIAEIREGYITVGRGFPVIIVKRLSPDEVCDLRTQKRRQPHPEMKIMIGADYLKIIDISSTGAHLVHTVDKKSILPVGDTIILTIQNGADQYDRPARIIRRWHSWGAGGHEHLAVIFMAEKI